jgi:hypothetical protein
MRQKIDPLSLIVSNPGIDGPTKDKITKKIRLVEVVVSEIEELTGISYPSFYVEPKLTVSISPDSSEGIGIFYARTIPVESNGIVTLLVQLSAALVLYATKNTLKLVLAHEFLHYIALVRNFSSGRFSSDTTPSFIFEDRFEDASRAIDPERVFPKKRKLTKDLMAESKMGFSDEKLNEKCRKLWIEKGRPTVKLPLGENQMKISVYALTRSTFDPDVLELLSKTRK